ncbi:MAG TPA: substrate-binding domain-containing protein [Candidatus Tumulicola sp.]|jgi:phosphate transport system substrate-binding protein
MNKTLATLAMATVPALLLSACNGGAMGPSGTAALPATSHGVTGHAKPNDNGPQDLHAGGATFPAYAYNLGNQPVGSYNQAQTPPGNGSLFNAAPTNGTIYYCLTGSGAGRKAFEGGPGESAAPATGPCAPLGATATGFGGRMDPLDFVGSDVALASTEYQTYVQYRETGSQQWGEPFEFPTIGGPIVYGYRAKDFSASKIQFAAWTYCAIANGTITDWNDPAITRDNDGASVTGGKSEPITFYFRSDSSGTSYQFTNHLNTACNVKWKAPYNKAPYESSGHSAAWSFGVNSTWPGPGSSGDPNPNFIGESGNPGVLAAVQSTPFSTGYLEGAYAKSANPPVAQALLQNGGTPKNPIFVDPTNKTAVANAFKKVVGASITYGEGSDGVPLGTSRPECVLYIDPSHFVTPQARAYPIVGISYFLFYGNNNGVHVSDKKALITYMESKAATKVVKKLEYTPLPASIQNAVLNALNGTGSKSACLQ